MLQVVKVTSNIHLERFCELYNEFVSRLSEFLYTVAEEYICIWLWIHLLEWFFSRNIPEARKVGGKYVGLSKLKNLLITPRDQFKWNGTLHFACKWTCCSIKSCIWIILCHLHIFCRLFERTRDLTSPAVPGKCASYPPEVSKYQTSIIITCNAVCAFGFWIPV